MSKTYILQKDLPEAKAGAKWVLDEMDNTYNYHDGKENCWYKKRYVENNPEWFLPEENKSNDSFQWTDSLVEKYVSWCKTRIQTSVDPMYLFKQSHTPKPQAEKGTMIRCIVEAGMIIEPQINAGWFEKGKRCRVKAVSILDDKVLFDDFISAQLSALVNDIHDGKFKIIEPQAENKPDRDYSKYDFTDAQKPIPQPKPDWEIVEMNDVTGGRVHIYDVDGCKYNKCTIHSVKRLSDGEVFSVGDDEGEEKIVSFWIEGKDMMAKLHGKYGTTGISIKGIRKPQKEEQRIEVKGFGVRNDGLVGAVHYQFTVKNRIPSTKVQSVVSAIEQVLNDDKPLSYSWQVADCSGPNGEKLYTQQQVDAMCEDVWSAAREDSYSKTTRMTPNAQLIDQALRLLRYSSYEHYKQTMRIL